MADMIYRGFLISWATGQLSGNSGRLDGEQLPRKHWRFDVEIQRARNPCRFDTGIKRRHQPPLRSRVRHVDHGFEIAVPLEPSDDLTPRLSSGRLRRSTEFDLDMPDDIQTLADFIEWEDRQTDRHEFVNGTVVEQDGFVAIQADIAASVLFALKTQLKDTRCRAFGSGIRIQIPETGNVRYPAVSIDCGELHPDAKDLEKPTVVFDVVSASAETSDLEQRRRDYGSVPTVTDYVVVRYDVVSIEVWRRCDGGTLRCPGAITDLNSVIELPEIGVEISIMDVYDGAG
jgi:Uma2 family endonuclease